MLYSTNQCAVTLFGYPLQVHMSVFEFCIFLIKHHIETFDYYLIV